MAVNIRATIRRRRGGDRVIKVSESGGTRSRRRPARLLKDSGRTQPELRIPGAAAQTRVVCVAGIRVGSGESPRAFKGIICHDISEFESHMPSHAVSSLCSTPPPKKSRVDPAEAHGALARMTTVLSALASRSISALAFSVSVQT